MLAKNLIRFLVLIIISLFLYSCTDPDPVILPGEITGTVTDAETSQPIDYVLLRLMQNNVTTDSIRTVMDGTFSLESIDPGNYEIQASKSGYASKKENVSVKSAQPKEINFSLIKISTLDVSRNLLDFGLDSTTLKFSISKIGTGTLTYSIFKSQNWISVSPAGGEVTGDTEADIITVTIDRTDLQKRKYIETITVTQVISPEETQDFTIDVYLNGIWIDSKYVNIVRIGTQVWMGENLNVGTRIDGAKYQTNNGIIEKYCYYDNDVNCDIYGGLYQWDESMQYHPQDTGTIGSTQGICPDGWHIPTYKEWNTIQDNLGGYEVAGGKLKETGFAHWAAPNTGASNETGFTALPGGMLNEGKFFEDISNYGWWWTATLNTGSLDVASFFYLESISAYLGANANGIYTGFSVRCIKDQ